MSLSHELHKRVLLAKYMYQQAAETIGDADELSAFSAVLALHDSVELMMLAVLDHLGVKVDRRREFMDFWKEVESSGRKSPDFRSDLDRLNVVRKDAKHHGILPNVGQVRDLVPIIKSFLGQLSQDYLGIEFDAISLADLIEDPKCRALVTSAEANFAAGKRKDAFLDLKIAFLKIAEKDAAGLPAFKIPRQPPDFHELPSPLHGYLPMIHEAVACLGETVNVLMLGADPQRYWYFLASTPPVRLGISDAIQAKVLQEWDCPPEDVFENCRRFVIDYSLRSASVFRSPIWNAPRKPRLQIVEPPRKT